MRHVRVTWLDATTSQHGGWKSARDIIADLDPSRSTFTGWVLHEAEKYIIFAAHRISEGDDESFDGDLCLPKGCIESMEEVPDGLPGRDRSANPARKRGKLGAKKRSRPRVG